MNLGLAAGAEAVPNSAHYDFLDTGEKTAGVRG
jgi:hypothetical protein